MKIYIALSCLVGFIQICSGFILGAGVVLSPRLEQLFDFYGWLGAFGGLELLWLASSTVALLYCMKQNISFVPPVFFIAFCLLHPLIAVLVPSWSFDTEPAIATAKFVPAMFEIISGLAFVMLNIICYKGYFFVPRLFDK